GRCQVLEVLWRHNLAKSGLSGGFEPLPVYSGNPSGAGSGCPFGLSFGILPGTYVVMSSQYHMKSSLAMTHKLDNMIELPQSHPNETYKEDLECDMVMVKIPRCTQWLDTYDEPIGKFLVLKNWSLNHDPSCPTLDVSLEKERGPEPPIKPYSSDSFTMKVVESLTIHTPHSPHVASFHLKDVYCYYHPCIDDPKKHYGFKLGLSRHIRSLGYSSKNYVRKFLRALHAKWRTKVTTIEESKDLTSLSLDKLIGNLKVHEMIIKKDSEIVKDKKERKSLTLKAKKESGDEECWTSRKCPKPPKDENQRAFVEHSWSDSGEKDDEKANDETCLVAQASSESYEGNLYTLVIVDDYSRYTWTRFLKNKTEAFEKFEIFSLVGTARVEVSTVGVELSTASVNLTLLKGLTLLMEDYNC
nr:UBN2 domain-containing protein [Tanacetum cinerariifolium]